MDYPLSSLDLQQHLEDEELFEGVFSYDALPELRDGQFCIANTDNIYPGLDPVEGGAPLGYRVMQFRLVASI